MSALTTWMVGQNALSASLLVVPNWEKWSIRWRAGLLLRRTWSGWRNALTGTSWSSTQASARSCPRGGVTSRSRRGWWQANGLKKQLQKTNQHSGSWWTSSWMLFSSKKVNCILSSIIKNVVSRSRCMILPPCLALVRVHLKCYVWVWALHFKEDISMLKWVKWRVTKTVKELEHMMDEDRLRKQGLFCLKKRRLRDTLFLSVTTWVDGARLLPELCSDRMGSSGRKLEHWKWQLDIGKNFFYHEGSQTLKLLALRVCGISVLGRVWDLTGHSPEQPALARPPLSREPHVPSNLSYSIVLFFFGH